MNAENKILYDLPEMISHYSRILLISKEDPAYKTLEVACANYKESKDYTKFLTEIRLLKENKNV